MGLRFEVFSADPDATADFYARVLGFALLRDERQATVPYLFLRRDAVQVGAVLRRRVDRLDLRRPLPASSSSSRSTTWPQSGTGCSGRVGRCWRTCSGGPGA